MDRQEARKTAIAIHALRLAIERLSTRGNEHLATLDDLKEAQAVAPAVAWYALDPAAFLKYKSVPDEAVDELLAFVMEAAMVDAEGTVNPHITMPEGKYERRRMRAAVRAWFDLYAAQG